MLLRPLVCISPSRRQPALSPAPLLAMPSFAPRRRATKKGVTFSLMVVGASGTGKTTFVNTLCGGEVLGHKVADDPASAVEEDPIKIKPVDVELEEDGVRIGLTIVDTPGFGDNIDNNAQFAEIVGYLEHQFDELVALESRIKRSPRFRDNRVHALLYFIPATGHALREMDIELMRRLSPRVNVIPVIGKADTLTASERNAFKQRVRLPSHFFPFCPCPFAPVSCVWLSVTRPSFGVFPTPVDCPGY